MNAKSKIRKEILNKRDSISDTERNLKSDTIQRNILKSELFQKSDCILMYMDFHGEVQTHKILENALLSGKNVFFPRVLNSLESKMEFYEIFSADELFKGYKGISEPLARDERVFKPSKYDPLKMVMFVPGVAFDYNGNRLGYGKGYYDTYLKDKPFIYTCGLCFTDQIVTEIPFDENDIRLNKIVTEATPYKDIKR
jgi:5-formyltetrahydrofolate cyclo-ligase